MSTTVTIIGGGLSGLLVAYRLAQKDIDFKLLEANSRFGGRILSTLTNDLHKDKAPQPAIDLGPSWFWPGQNKIASLIQELELGKFVYSQASSGASVVEYGDGTIQTSHGSASMAGSHRLSGGMAHLINRLIEAIPSDALVTEAPVTKIKREDSSMVTVATVNKTPYEILSKHVVLAVPPRIVAKTITFDPSLPNDYVSKLTSVPTWMAGQAKFVAIYDESFWREKELSGDGLSQIGPLMEIHDASPESSGPYALFGFVGVPAAQRLNRDDDIKAAAIEQLARMFGEQASRPVSVHFKDWAHDPFTAVDLDRDGPQMHASSSLKLIAVPEFDVLWAGTETATGLNQSNGYIEGAVEAGERAASLLMERLGLPEQAKDSS